MGTIIMGYASESQMDRDALQGMFRLRHRVFKERMGWDVKSDHGLERDDYDDLNPVYMVSRNHLRDVEGCWRLLPTTGPYMLKDTFPELLGEQPAPRDPHIWELSRFVIAPLSSGDCRQARINPLMLEMMQKVIDFSDQRDICSYVTVTSVALERMMRRIGIPLQRLGDGKAKWIGKVLSVACLIEVNDESRDVVHGAFDVLHEQQAA